MKRSTKRSSIIFAAAFVLGTSAWAITGYAQNQGGVKVGKDVDIKVQTGDVTTSAEGDNAIAETNIGSVTGHNTEVKGGVKIKVKTGDVTTRAKGDGARACSNIGTVGTSACQR